MKWERTGRFIYELIEGPYHAKLYIIRNDLPRWIITREGQTFDYAEKHSPVTTKFNQELAAKAQIERIIRKYIDNDKTKTV